MENDFSKVKVNDKIFHFKYGWGTVKGVYFSTFEAKFIKTNNIKYFFYDGRTNNSDTNPSVFWDEVKIIPPSKQKRKVEKIIEGWINIYPYSSGDIEIAAQSYGLYKSSEFADLNAFKEERIGEAYHVTHKYTSEE